MSSRWKSEGYTLGVSARRLAFALFASSPPRGRVRSAGFSLHSLGRNPTSRKMAYLLTVIIAGSCGSSTRFPIAASRSYAVVPGGEWSTYDYTYFCPAYKFSETGQASTPWSILNANSLAMVKQSHQHAFNATESHIRSIAGDFFDELVFDDVDIVYSDSSLAFDNKLPLYDAEKCGISRYFFRYRYHPFRDVEYRIGIALDADLNVISRACFPAISAGYVPSEIISPKLTARTASSQLGSHILPIGDLQLRYDEQIGAFVWHVKQRAPTKLKDGEHWLQYAEFNAHTGVLVGQGSYLVKVVGNHAW